MATRRSQSNAPNLLDLEQSSNPVETPGIMPPPGVKANVETRVRYERMIDPEASEYSDNLRELAGEEFDNNELPEPTPQDPYSEFLYTWQRYTGYPLKIVRMADPATRRMPGQTYNRPCFEMEILSDTPFDPNNLTGMLQVINGNSGGVFRVWLTDETGHPIPGARLDRLVVADPPKQYNQREQRHTPYYTEEEAHKLFYRRESQTAPAPPQKSENELFIEQMQRDLFQKVMMRALDPPPPPVTDPLNSLPESDRLALSLLKQGDLLSSVVERIASLAQAPERIESSTWKDKLAEAGVNLVTQNPQIITTVTDIISRATVAFASALAPRNNQQVVSEPIPVQPIHRPPAQRSAPQIHSASAQPRASINTDLPEAPVPEEEDDLEQDEIDMMEELTKLLLSDKPLSFNDPAILDIRATYPEIFDKALAGIAATPSMMIIQYLCGKSEFCADMFMSPRNGPHLKARLEELKLLIKNSSVNQVTVHEVIKTAAAREASEENNEQNEDTRPLTDTTESTEPA